MDMNIVVTLSMRLCNDIMICGYIRNAYHMYWVSILLYMLQFGIYYIRCLLY